MTDIQAKYQKLAAEYAKVQYPILLVISISDMLPVNAHAEVNSLN